MHWLAYIVLGTATVTKSDTYIERAQAEAVYKHNAQPGWQLQPMHTAILNAKLT